MSDLLETMNRETALIREELEQKRQIFFRLFIMGAPMFFSAACAVGAMKTDHGVFPWPVVLMVTLVVTAIGFQIANGLYRRQTKKMLMDKVAASLGLTYDRRGVFSIQDVAPHRIIPPHHVCAIEDGFRGTVLGYPVSFQEVTLSDRVPYTRQDGTREDREETVFWGLIIRIGIGKKLESHTVVLPRNSTLTFLRTVFSAFERVNMASTEFSARFDVMSTSQVEARYVLDPAFMERFMEAGKLLGSKWMEASFRDNEIAFAVQRNRPMFEIGWLFRPLNDKALEGTLNELKAVINLVTVLKLNPYTGLGAIRKSGTIESPETQN